MEKIVLICIGWLFITGGIAWLAFEKGRANGLRMLEKSVEEYVNTITTLNGRLERAQLKPKISMEDLANYMEVTNASLFKHITASLARDIIVLKENDVRVGFQDDKLDTVLKLYLAMKFSRSVDNVKLPIGAVNAFSTALYNVFNNRYTRVTPVEVMAGEFTADAYTSGLEVASEVLDVILNMGSWTDVNITAFSNVAVEQWITIKTRADSEATNRS